MSQEQYWQQVGQWEQLRKVCRICKQERPLLEFPAHKEMSDGHRHECKACTKAWIFKWRQENRERLWAKDREYAARPEIRAKIYARNEQWRRDNPAVRKVHYLFHQALKQGLVKPQLCWVCGEKAEAHHADYSAPLDVVWLCRSHHKQTHALIQGTST